jgi:hypothetical protein
MWYFLGKNIEKMSPISRNINFSTNSKILDQTIIITSIIGEENFNKLSLIEFIKSRKNNTINGYINHHWNGVTCLQLAKNNK